MSSATRQVVTLPDTLRSVLEIRTRTGLVCPNEVVEKLQKIPYFRVKVAGGAGSEPRASTVKASASPTNPVPANRFSHLGTSTAPDGWRTMHPVTATAESSRFQFNSSRTETEDGFEVWSSRKKNTFSRHESSHGSSHGSAHGSAHEPSHKPSHGLPRGSSYKSSHETSHSTSRELSRGSSYPVTHGPTSPGVISHEGGTNAWKSSRFKPLEDKIANESTEDRIMGKVRSKINKIGESTYEPTKAFMQQILDSGNTDFLGEFMEFVFQKAATEPSFCGIYARLLHELADEFSHLRTEMELRFREYTLIFVETEQTPDVGTADYIKFVESQTKKKFRRGYSQFVAELAKLGEVNFADFRSLIESIVASILQVYISPDNILLCEEYVDCLNRMCHAGASMLEKETWANAQIHVLKGIISAPRSSSPGLSNKARFALMDLQDFVGRGWK